MIFENYQNDNIATEVRFNNAFFQQQLSKLCFCLQTCKLGIKVGLQKKRKVHT